VYDPVCRPHESIVEQDTNRMKDVGSETQGMAGLVWVVLIGQCITIRRKHDHKCNKDRAETEVDDVRSLSRFHCASSLQDVLFNVNCRMSC